MMNIRHMFVLAILFCTSTLMGQGIVGVWETIDDESGEAKSHVEIYEKGDKYYGKVIELLPAAKTTKCENCEGDLKGASIEGMVIIKNLEPYKDYYSYGTILDPSSGKEYKCSAWVEGDKLKVRGYVGISALGRTQVWNKVK